MEIKFFPYLALVGWVVAFKTDVFAWFAEDFAISNVEDRNRLLSQKVNSVKIYQRVFKHAISMQCKFCNIFFPAEVFIDHVKTCTKDNAGQRSIFFKIPLTL